MCCRGPFIPWSENAYVWGNICGYTPSNPDVLVGGECLMISTTQTCPQGSYGGCCAGIVPGQCALGTDCGAPDIPSPPPLVFSPAPLPDGWDAVSPCVQDTPSRVLANVIDTQLGNNTPSNCIQYCVDFGYTFAGVEYGVECFCGTGLLPGTPAADTIDASNCDTPCYGDHQYACGGSWAIQLYQGSPAPLDLPNGWSVAAACAVNTAARVIADDVTTVLSNNTPGTCAAACQELGYTYAGVEYSNECHCGSGFTGGVVPKSAPMDECDMPCNGNQGLTCGGEWRVQIYASD
ncbi:hypothetical protein EIP86_006879 [Pleurotus ostreatoroseus]|nr:hypothetical protein EIP86_006879 [Pleurotus ostreatoroseus]